MYVLCAKRIEIANGGFMRQLAVPAAKKNLRRNRWSFAACSVLLSLAPVGLTGCAPTPASTDAPKNMSVPASFVKVREAGVRVKGEWVGKRDGFVNPQIQPQVRVYLVRQKYHEGSPVAKEVVRFEI